MQIIEFDASGAESAFDELPEEGDSINHGGEEMLVTSVTIVNETYLTLKAVKKRGVEYVEDPLHPSFGTDETLPDKFLEGGSTDFLKKQSLKVKNND